MKSMSTVQKQAASLTPMEVKARRMDFPYDDVSQRDFFDNNAVKSAYIAALSATFPAGEGEFIKSVRMFRDQTNDEELRSQVKGFIGQEAHHSLQHKRFNIALKEKGLDVPRLEGVFEKDLAWSIKKRSNEQRLAFTVCVEHMTAMLANDFLTNPERLRGMDPTIEHLMRWHAVEEIEHKSVAFDLYMDCVGDRDLLRRSMKIAAVLLSYRFAKYTVKLLWWSKRMPSWKDLKGYWSFMYGKGSLMRSIAQPYKDFFREDFHPWDHDDRHLIDEWKKNSYDAKFDAFAGEQSAA
jgi:uncharacterized protein